MNFTAYIFLAVAASPTELLLKPTPGLYIWTIITFLLLFFVLRKFAWKPLLNALNEREDCIDLARNIIHFLLANCLLLVSTHAFQELF